MSIQTVFKVLQLFEGENQGADTPRSPYCNRKNVHDVAPAIPSRPEYPLLPTVLHGSLFQIQIGGRIGCGSEFVRVKPADLERFLSAFRTHSYWIVDGGKSVLHSTHGRM